MATTGVPDEGAFDAFGDRLTGEFLGPDDEGYEAARAVWNGLIDKRPAAIARCEDADDVIAAVDFARKEELPLAVRAGGHSFPGLSVCDDGLVVDLSSMNGVEVDPEARRARVGAGATWGDFDAAAQEYGLATTGGVDSRTGVAGLTLGGGIGYLARTYGLACDNLVGADVVTADGELVHASEDEHRNLFWALRGGGGNFGVVTNFEFRLHEVGPEVLAGLVFHPLETAPEVMRFYREFMADAPDAVSCLAVFVTVPPEPPFPEEYHGETGLALMAFHSGPIGEAESSLAPLREFDEPIFDGVQPMPYTALQQAFNEGTPDGERYYGKSAFMADIPDEAVSAIVDRVGELPSPFTTVFFESMGGAVARVDPSATAFPHREPAFNFSITAGWSDPDRDDEVIDWTRELHAAVAPYATDRVYVNYLDGDADDRVDVAYGRNHDRLAAVKAEWDPENLFRLNKNVAPARGG